MTRSGEGESAPDVTRIVETFERHGVEYLIVGGVSAQVHGAQRATGDFDCLPVTTRANLERLAAAMRELGARLRVEGLSDEQARELPIPLDGAWLANMDISTWRTDAGDLDVMTGMPARDGRRRSFADLVPRARRARLGPVSVLVPHLDDIIASKEWADRPKDREALDELRALAEADRP